MRSKIQIFEGPNAEKVTEEVNLFTEDIENMGRSDIQIIPMAVGGLVLAPSNAGMITMAADGATPCPVGTISPCVFYSIAVTWKE